jgi:phosphoenolpyruvate carboxykinase (diphosphate)
VFTVKRYYRPEWGENWREHFTVDRINGFLGHELKFDNQKAGGQLSARGFRSRRLLADLQAAARFFHPAEKVQVEDDITASVVAAAAQPEGPRPEYPNRSVKLVENCERSCSSARRRHHRGFDAQAEADIATPGTFLSNFEPLTVGRSAGDGGSCGRVRSIHRAHEAAAAEFRAAPKGGLTPSRRTRAWWTAPFEESALSAEAARSGEPAGRYLAEMCARLDRGFRRTSRCTSR